LKLQITIDGKSYEVDVEVLEEEENSQAPSHAPYHSTPAVAGGDWDAEARMCHSPVMGLVIKVNVASGQAVDAGDLLLVLEAMKMETKVTAPRAGTIRGVRVVKGDSVKVNQILVELE
jgi:methylmalonyl-CoA carboxyltransferase 1.3S subunit